MEEPANKQDKMKGKMKPPIEQDWHRFVKFHGKDKHNNWKMECLGCGKKMLGTLPKWREHVLPSENKNPNRVLRCKRRNPEAIAMASAKRTSSTKREEAGAAVLETMSGQVETAIDLVGRCKPGATRASSESSIQPYN